MNNTIRDDLRELLVNNIPSLNNNVWEPGAIAKEMEKPFAVIREGVVTKTQSFDDRSMNFEVWPHVLRSSLTDLDNLCKEIEQVLNNIIIMSDGIPYYVQFDGLTSEDLIIEDWDAYAKSMSFTVFVLDWRNHSDSTPDPIKGMVEWTNKYFDYQTNPKDWHPSDEYPAVYWRQEAVTSEEPTHWGGFINARLRCHVISPSLELRKKAVESIVRRLIKPNHTHLEDGSVMLFRGVSSNDGYNPFTTGQITLDVRYGIIDMPTYRQLKNVEVNNEDKVKGGVHIE